MEKQDNLPLKKETLELPSKDPSFATNPSSVPPPLIDSGSSSGSGLSSGNDSDVSSCIKRPILYDEEVQNSSKKPKVESVNEYVVQDSVDVPVCNDVAMPVGFFDPLQGVRFGEVAVPETTMSKSLVTVRKCKQFWKAGDYEDDDVRALHPNSSYSAGMDHVRVHPKFLHSNATSHKWALGAFAELLDNALDEVCNGATYVNTDVLISMKDNNQMLLFQDNGGGMNPDKMRQCMSLGYSAKSKLANTIGQYGNGFKTSTMRLGADVIVFSSCQGKDGTCPTKSIGMLSYTFLQGTGKEDIVVPMIDYENEENVLTKLIRSSVDDWERNLDTIIQWSPYSSEEELLQQLDSLDDQGTRIIIYNLWEDDMGQLELDFETDPEDIQMRGVNRDEKKIAMAKQYPNSKHFLTYQHSLRSYASILYLRLPPGFRIILRGKDIEHHSLVNDMMHKKELSYRPQIINDGPLKDSDTSLHAFVTLGFAKDAKDHIDIQGFNVYHKNRLIKPFWRLWNAAGSDGRGVIGVLEANFVEPAHDKQGFERTTALSRLEARLIALQKNYWRENCHEIGYAPRRAMNRSVRSATVSAVPITSVSLSANTVTRFDEIAKKIPACKATPKSVHGSPYVNHSSEDGMSINHLPAPLFQNLFGSQPSISGGPHTSPELISANNALMKLRKENLELKRQQDSSISRADDLVRDLQYERDRCKSLQAKLDEANKKIAEMDKEHESLIQIFTDERERREAVVEALRKDSESASRTIHELLAKLRTLPSCKIEKC